MVLSLAASPEDPDSEKAADSNYNLYQIIVSYLRQLVETSDHITDLYNHYPNSLKGC